MQLLLIAGCLQLSYALLYNAPSLQPKHARLALDCRHASNTREQSPSLPAVQVKGSVDAKERQHPSNINAQVQALGRANNWRGVLTLLDEAKMEEFKPSSPAWRAAIQAMGKQWEEAVKLIDRMKREGAEPNLFHYNAALSACSRAAQWQQAEQLLTAMQSAGLTADLYTYSAMITAYSSGKQWQKAEQMFTDLQNTGKTKKKRRRFAYVQFNDKCIW
jgi:pentatricopeptide repeat protein